MLIEYGDGLLDTPYGLADDPNCCCTDDTTCPPCCIEITSGALLAGEIKIFDEQVVVIAGVDRIASIEITITTSSGTRRVCSGDTVTVRVESFLDGLEDGNRPVEIITDPVWEMVSAAGADAHQVKPGGWAYWETDSDGNVSANLKLNSCFFNATDVSNYYGGLGPITVRSGAMEEVIAIERCQPTVSCCTRVVECEPCCLAMPHDAISGVVLPYWTWNASLSRWERLYHIRATKTVVGSGDPGDPTTSDDIGYWVIAWISGERQTIFCLERDIQFGVEIGFQEWRFSSGAMFTVHFNFCDFEYVSVDAGSSPTVNTGPPLTIDWVEQEDTEYAATFNYNCSFPGIDCVGGITFSVGVTGTGIVGGSDFWDPAEGSGLLELEQCENPTDVNCCNCCCNCDFNEASLVDLDITDGGTRYRLWGGPYSLAPVGIGEFCSYVIGITIHGSGTSFGTLILNYCQSANGGWWLQAANSQEPYIETEDGPCTGQIDVTKPGVTGFITVEGGKPCPGID